MDIWVQRLLAIIVLISVAGLVFSYTQGNDGQVFAYLTGLITGILGALSVGNVFVKPDSSPESKRF
jgi:hypothetical protein